MLHCCYVCLLCHAELPQARAVTQRTARAMCDQNQPFCMLHDICHVCCWRITCIWHRREQAADVEPDVDSGRLIKRAQKRSM
jgi:hypothetical protein